MSRPVVSVALTLAMIPVSVPVASSVVVIGCISASFVARRALVVAIFASVASAFPVSSRTLASRHVPVISTTPSTPFFPSTVVLVKDVVVTLAPTTSLPTSFIAVLRPLFQSSDTTETALPPGSLRGRRVPPRIGELTHALREIDMNAMIIDEHTLHLEVCSFTILLVCEFDKGILQAVASLLVPYDLATENLAEATEDELEVLVASDGIELADKEHLLWGRNVGERQVANEFESESLRTSLSFATKLLQSLWICVLLQFLVIRDANCRELRGRRNGTRRWNMQSWRIHERIIYYDGVENPDVLEGTSAIVYEGSVDFFQSIKALNDLTENGSLPVQQIQILAQGDDELAACKSLIRIGG